MAAIDFDAVDFAKGGGLVTVVTQDATTGAVLMVAYADREALQRTVDSGQMHYTSRTRGLWHKGATSGNTQRVVSLALDCDGDSILARVAPAGPACHEGTISCFGELALEPDALAAVSAVIESRAASLESSGAPSYTQRLLSDRNLRLKKLGEEAAELVIACADGERARSAEEGADLFYHALVALRSVGVSLRDLQQVLSERSSATAGKGLNEGVADIAPG
jgi:phosphoribosyl-ATP pyrophosphohydrolase/phosphoribosyl-AMP cyclohydrolase